MNDLGLVAPLGEPCRGVTRKGSKSTGLISKFGPLRLTLSRGRPAPVPPLYLSECHITSHPRDQKLHNQPVSATTTTKRNPGSSYDEPTRPSFGAPGRGHVILTEFSSPPGAWQGHVKWGRNRSPPHVNFEAVCLPQTATRLGRGRFIAKRLWHPG
ncbi:hypothetical protein H6P81_014167 [Aristolochia fimbriata]|uniref:Uncharacterized protein n=1 Tax=Aristolochia fimbriata TaxID=158543 RepID=A0AAV7EH85_ARIFI|nr:hypothetical protein H6P81_014167 [Aristolochia fimbriata]